MVAELQRAADLGATPVEVRSNSKLVIEMLSTRMPATLAGLLGDEQDLKTLVRRFCAVSFRWIPRARNEGAEELAAEAIGRSRTDLATRLMGPDIRADEFDLADMRDQGCRLDSAERRG